MARTTAFRNIGGTYPGSRAPTPIGVSRHQVGASGRPRAGGDDQQDRDDLARGQVLAEHDEPGRRGHRRLEAHQHAEHARGHPPQRLQLERVGDRRRQHRRRRSRRRAPRGRAGRAPPSAIPIGASGTTATSIASASPPPPGKAWPTRAASRMYAAQNAPAIRASATPSPSRSAPPKSDSSRIPAAASATQTQVERPARAEHGHAQRADELERHGHAERDAVERRVEREVHPRQRRAEQQRPGAGRGGCGPRAAAARSREHERREQHPQEDRAARGRSRRRATSRTRRRTAPTHRGDDEHGRRHAIRGRWSAGHGRARYPGRDNPTRGRHRCRPLRARPLASAPTRSSSGSSPASTPRSPSSTSTRCGRTRARCWAARAGTPIRVASKSVRCRSLLAAILEHDRGFEG